MTTQEMNLEDSEMDLEALENKGTPPEKTEHVPPENSKRFKEIYWKSKEFDRQQAEFEEMKNTIAVMKKHNEALASTITGIDDKNFELSKPDRDIDPEGYDKWLINKAKREFVAEQKTKEVHNPKTDIQPNIQADPYEAAIRTIHNDYDIVIGIVNADMNRDPVLKNDIMSKPPEIRYKAAYDYGKKRLEKIAKDKDNLLDQGQLEGGQPPVSGNKVVLSAEEKRVAQKLGIPKDKYLAQKKYIMGVK